MASCHYQLGLAQAYSGKLTAAEVNFQFAIRILEARKNNIAKMENSDSVAMEKIDLEMCIQEIKEVVVDQKEMHKQIATGLLPGMSLGFNSSYIRHVNIDWLYVPGLFVKNFTGFVLVQIPCLNVSISGTVGAKLTTRMGMKLESMMSAKQSGTATVGSA